MSFSQLRESELDNDMSVDLKFVIILISVTGLGTPP
jgi:hypothetical protein